MPHWSAVEPESKYNDLRSLELQRKLELSPLLSPEAQAWPTVGPSDWWLMGLQSALLFQTLASAWENPAALRNRLYSFLLNTSHRCELPVSSELFIIHTMVSVLRKNYDSIFCKTKCPMNWWTKAPKTRGQVDLHEIGNRFMSPFFSAFLISCNFSVSNRIQNSSPEDSRESRLPYLHNNYRPPKLIQASLSSSLPRAELGFFRQLNLYQELKFQMPQHLS